LFPPFYNFISLHFYLKLFMIPCPPTCCPKLAHLRACIFAGRSWPSALTR
jgi:hypothetical protein